MKASGIRLQEKGAPDVSVLRLPIPADGLVPTPAVRGHGTGLAETT